MKKTILSIIFLISFLFSGFIAYNIYSFSILEQNEFNSKSNKNYISNKINYMENKYINDYKTKVLNLFNKEIINEF